MNNSTTIISKMAEANSVVNANGVFPLDAERGIAGVRTQMYIAKKVTGFGTGKHNLLDGKLDPKVGVTTFEKSKLPSNKTYLVLGVKVLQSTDVASDVQVSNFNSVSSPEIKNGDISIKQDGQIVKLNIGECTPEADADGKTGKQYFECTPFRLQGSSDVEIETEFTGNTTDGHSIKVVLDVIEETVNAKVRASVMNNC